MLSLGRPLTMTDRLQHVFLLQLLYLFRISPSFSLRVYDDAPRSIQGTIAITRLDDKAWNQASLPVKAGRLGIRSAVQLSPTAFLSSAAASADLVWHILPPCFKSQDLLLIDSALASWSVDQDQDHPPPVALASHRQNTTIIYLQEYQCTVPVSPHGCPNQGVRRLIKYPAHRFQDGK